MRKEYPLIFIMLLLSVALQACKPRTGEVSDVKVEMNASEEFIEQFTAFRQKMLAAIDKLEEKEGFREVNVLTEGEFGADGEDINILNLEVQYDKTLLSDEKALYDLGKESFKIIIDIIQKAPYDEYQVEFFQDAISDRPDETRYRSFTYTRDELIGD